MLQNLDFTPRWVFSPARHGWNDNGKLRGMEGGSGREWSSKARSKVAAFFSPAPASVGVCSALGEKEAAELFTLTLNEEKAADKKLSLLAKSINVKAKAEKPPASVKTAVKESAKLPVKIPSGGQREVQGIESNMEAKQSQPE